MPATTAFVEACVDRLLRGEDGASVVASLREHYSSHCSFEKFVSKTRRQYLKRAAPDPGFKAAMAGVRQLLEKVPTADAGAKDTCARMLRHFEALSLPDQYDAMRAYRKRGFCEGCPAVSAAMSEVRLLPASMDTFALSAADAPLCRATQRRSLIRRNEKVVHLPDAADFVESQLDVLKNEKSSVSRLALALLAVSGRRVVEILNGRSVFAPVAWSAHHAMFVGQTKKRDRPLRPAKADFVMTIPMLCQYRLFARALARMRGMQAADVRELSNSRVSRRYAAQIHGAQKQHYAFLGKTHDLRGVYVRLVSCCFSSEIALPLLCALCLGHDHLNESLHYMSIKLDNADGMRRTLGPLRHSKFVQYRRLVAKR